MFMILYHQVGTQNIQLLLHVILNAPAGSYHEDYKGHIYIYHALYTGIYFQKACMHLLNFRYQYTVSVNNTYFDHNYPTWGD